MAQTRRSMVGFAHAALALNALALGGGLLPGPILDIDIGYPYGRRRRETPFDAHVEARERHIAHLAAKERAANAEREKRERGRPMIEAADAKRARRNAKRAAASAALPVSRRAGASHV